MGTSESYTCAAEGCDFSTINPGWAAQNGHIRRDGSWLCPEHKPGADRD